MIKIEYVFCLFLLNTAISSVNVWVPRAAQCHLLEVGVFVFLLYMGVAALLREDINLFDTANHRQNPQVTTSHTHLDVLINRSCISLATVASMLIVTRFGCLVRK